MGVLQEWYCDETTMEYQFLKTGGYWEQAKKNQTVDYDPWILIFDVAFIFICAFRFSNVIGNCIWLYHLGVLIVCVCCFVEYWLISERVYIFIS